MVLSLNDDASAENRITQASESVSSVHPYKHESLTTESTLHISDGIDRVEVKSPSQQTICERSDVVEQLPQDCERPRLIHSAPAGQIACPVSTQHFCA